MDNIKEFQDQVADIFESQSADEALDLIDDCFPDRLDSYLAKHSYWTTDDYFHQLKARLRALAQSVYENDDQESVWQIRDIAEKLDESHKDKLDGVAFWDVQDGLLEAHPIGAYDLDSIVEGLASDEDHRLHEVREHFGSLLNSSNIDPAIDYLMDEFGEDYVAGTMDGLGIMAGQDGDAILDIYRDKCGSAIDHHAYQVAREMIDKLSREDYHYIFVDIYDDQATHGFKAPKVRQLMAEDCWKLWDIIAKGEEHISSVWE